MAEERDFFADLEAMSGPWVPSEVGDRFSISGQSYSPREVYVIYDINYGIEFGKGWDVTYLLDGTPKETYIGFIHTESLARYAKEGLLRQR